MNDVASCGAKPHALIFNINKTTVVCRLWKKKKKNGLSTE